MNMLNRHLNPILSEVIAMKVIQAALYARVSSDQQANAQTIDSQVMALRDRIRDDGSSASAEMEFIDDGWSGATLMRPALERLRDMAAFGGIDRLYVHSPDRLARKYAYQVLLIDELQRACVEIIFLNHATGKTPEDDLLLQVQGMVSEYERAKILERSRRGKRHKAQNGQVSVLSCAPYGYRYVNVAEGSGSARYEIVEQEAQVVQQIFDWIGRERSSIRQVCRQLQDQCTLTRRGQQRWDSKTIWSMLKNPAYCGLAAYGKTRTSTPQARLRPQRNQRFAIGHATISMASDQWLGIPVPAIVDADLFATVQAQLEENRKLSRHLRSQARYLLQGLVVCKQCGYAYYGKPHISGAATGGMRYYYYRCSGTDAYRFGGVRICPSKQIRLDSLEYAVWQEVCGLLNDPQRLQIEYERRLQAMSEPKDGVRRKGLDKQLRQCSQGITRLIDAYADGYLEKADFELRIQRLKERRQELEMQCEQLDIEASSHLELQLIVGRLETFATSVRDGLQDMDFTSKRELIRTLVKRVEVDLEQVNIVFRVDPAGKKSDSERNKPDCGRRGHPGGDAD
jgi:site-specific DNA recombinase